MATYKKRKFNWKSLISIVLVIGVVIGLAMGIKTIANDETKTVNKLGLFEVGSISEETGEHVESKNTLYTKKAFECQGLTVTPDFDNKAKYQIFWYNQDELYFGHTEVLSNKFVGNVPECARYCRIVVFPEPVDENGKEIKDFSIKFYEKLSYVKSLKIEVNKDQTWSPVDYYVSSQSKAAPAGHTPTINDGYEFYEGYVYFKNLEYNDFEHNVGVGTNPRDLMIVLDCSDMRSYKVTLGEHEESKALSYVVLDAEGNFLGLGGFSKAEVGATHVVDIPYMTGEENLSKAKYIVFTMYDFTRPIQINKYLPR